MVTMLFLFTVLNPDVGYRQAGAFLCLQQPMLTKGHARAASRVSVDGGPRFHVVRNRFEQCDGTGHAEHTGQEIHRT